MTPRQRDKAEREVIRHLQAGNFPRAVEILRGIVDDDPTGVRTLLKLGDVCVKAHDNAAAVEAYRAAAGVYEAQGFFLKAVAVSKQIVRTQPDDLVALQDMAELYALLGLHDDARAAIRALADGLVQAGRADEAGAALDQLADADEELWARRSAALGLDGRDDAVLVAADGPAPLGRAPVGHRATALFIAARNPSGPVAVDVGAAPGSRPAARGPLAWIAMSSGGAVVLRAPGAYAPATGPVDALRAVVAQAMASAVDVMDIVRAFAAFGGEPQIGGPEPPHREAGAVVFVAGDGQRVRVDLETLGVHAG